MAWNFYEKDKNKMLLNFSEFSVIYSRMTTYLKNGFHQELCRFRTATYPNTGLPQEVFLKDFDDRFLVKKNLISSCTNEKYLEALF